MSDENLMGERVLWVANGTNVPSLLLSFIEPLKHFPFVTAYLSEEDLKSDKDIKSGLKKWPDTPEVVERLRRRLSDFAPTLIVMCRYSGPYASNIIEWSREARVPTIYHIDDDLLNVPTEIGEAKARSHNAPRRTAAVRYLLDETTIAYCSTQPLARQLFGPEPLTRVFVGDIYCASEILAPPTTDEPPVIGYMGFGSHDYDFKFALPAVVRILDARPEVTFEIFGNIAVPEELKRFGDRIRTVEPIRDYGVFKQKLASLRWRIGICPLANLPFNEVKANTKWVEYSACGYAVVASRESIYRDCCSDGCGMLADTDDEWYAAFEKLIDDKAFHRAQVERAQQRVSERYSPDRLRGQILRVFEQAKMMTSDAPVVTSVTVDEIRGNELWGWAWTSTEKVADKERPTLELFVGDVSLARFNRRIHRPDVDIHLGTPAWPKGFLLPAGCLNALDRLMGGRAAFHPSLKFAGQNHPIFDRPHLMPMASFRTLLAADAVQGWRVADVWWANSSLLKVRASCHSVEHEANQLKLVRVFQPTRRADGALALELVDEFDVQAQEGVYPIGVRNPLMPILFIGYDDECGLNFTDLVPFPSLLRGGLHEAEAAAIGAEGGSLADIRRLSDAYLAEVEAGRVVNGPSTAIGAIEIDIISATGAEPIFDPAVREWLADVFDVSLGARNIDLRIRSDLGDSTFADHISAVLSNRQPQSPRSGASRLALPRFALPTVGALTSQLPSEQAYPPFIVVDEAVAHHRYHVAFPPDAPFDIFNPDVVEFPNVSSLGYVSATTAHNARPAAILFRDLTSRANDPRAKDLLLYPIPMDGAPNPLTSRLPSPSKITAIVRIRRNADIRLLLDCISAQATSAPLSVILLTANCHPAEIENFRVIGDDILPSRLRILTPETSLAFEETLGIVVGEMAADEVMVFVDPAIIPHDPRTFEALGRLALLEDVGTVGCMLLRGTSPTDSTPTFMSAGYFPKRVDFTLAPHIALEELDCSVILSTTVYPVAGNSPQFFAMSATAWRQAGGLKSRIPNEFAELDMAARLANYGRISVCTSLFSVFSDGVGAPSNGRELHCVSYQDIWRLMPAIKSSTIIRSF